MDVNKMIAHLREERDLIERVIFTLERIARGGPRRRGRPPKWLASGATKQRGRPRGAKMPRGTARAS